MRPYSKEFTPLDDTTDYLAAGRTGTGPWTPTKTSTTDGLAHVVTLTSTANLAAKTFTVTGTDPEGRAQTEAITGPDNSTVAGAKYWLTITQVSASGGGIGANTVDIGIADDAVTPAFPTDWRQGPPHSMSVSYVLVSGAATVTLQYSLTEIWDSTLTIGWHDHPTILNKTATTDSNIAYPVRAIRWKITASTAPTVVQFNMLQN